jgi:hypothetical protein
VGVKLIDGAGGLPERRGSYAFVAFKMTGLYKLFPRVKYW